MKMPVSLRIALVLAGLACLVGPAMFARDRSGTAGRPATSRAVVSGDLGMTVERTIAPLKTSMTTGGR